MKNGGLTSAIVRRLIAVSLLLAVSGPSVSPFAAALTVEEKCTCGCPQDGPNPCCCRRTPQSHAITLESATCCEGACRYAMQVLSRLSPWLPTERTRCTFGRIISHATIAVADESVPRKDFPSDLHQRPPP